MNKEFTTSSASASAPRRAALAGHRSTGGFGLMEAIMAMGLIMLIALSTTQAFLVSNRIAATNRVLTAARTIVQRNLDMAMSQRFDSTVVPPNLALTTNPQGATCDDDGGSDGQVNILIEKKSGGTQVVLVKGTLTRFVTQEPNAQSADIRRVTFRLTYPFQRRNFNVEMTGLRSIDD